MPPTVAIKPSLADSPHERKHRRRICMSSSQNLRSLALQHGIAASHPRPVHYKPDDTYDSDEVDVHIFDEVHTHAFADVVEALFRTRALAQLAPHGAHERTMLTLQRDLSQWKPEVGTEGAPDSFDPFEGPCVMKLLGKWELNHQSPLIHFGCEIPEGRLRRGQQVRLTDSFKQHAALF